MTWALVKIPNDEDDLMIFHSVMEDCHSEIKGEWSDSLIDKVIDDIKSTESEHTRLRLILEFLPEPIRDVLRVKAK